VRMIAIMFSKDASHQAIRSNSVERTMSALAQRRDLMDGAAQGTCFANTQGIPGLPGSGSFGMAGQPPVAGMMPSSQQQQVQQQQQQQPTGAPQTYPTVPPTAANPPSDNNHKAPDDIGYDAASARSANRVSFLVLGAAASLGALIGLWLRGAMWESLFSSSFGHLFNGMLHHHHGETFSAFSLRSVEASGDGDAKGSIESSFAGGMAPPPPSGAQPGVGLPQPPQSGFGPQGFGPPPPSSTLPPGVSPTPPPPGGLGSGVQQPVNAYGPTSAEPPSVRVSGDAYANEANRAAERISMLVLGGAAACGTLAGMWLAKPGGAAGGDSDSDMDSDND
ncbi:hypothetical protein FOZ62_006798, partial [Perkinsus olseni]